MKSAPTAAIDGMGSSIPGSEAALIRLNVDYWYEVDHNAGRHAHEFFVADAPVYQIQDREFHGREEIHRFYAWRLGLGDRVARHCVVNARPIVADGGVRATMDSILLLYAADGRPILPTASPIQIADVKDECVFIDGVWQYTSKRLITLFAGGVPITLPGEQSPSLPRG